MTALPSSPKIRISTDRDLGDRSRRGHLLVSIATVGRRCVLSAVGDADITTLECMKAGLATAARSRDREVWIDLTHLTCMDRRVADALAELQTTLQRDRRRLILVGPGHAVRRTLETVRPDDAFTTFADFVAAHALATQSEATTASSSATTSPLSLTSA